MVTVAKTVEHLSICKFTINNPWAVGEHTTYLTL